jgi:hypothetical protein
MKIALDVDGVLANFTQAFCEFAHSIDATDFPKTWRDCHDWDFGVGRERVMEVWNQIPDFKQFMLSLESTPDSKLHFTPVAYVTARTVPSDVTKDWLTEHGFPDAPVYTVGYNQSKVQILKDLRVDVFVEDRVEAAVELNAAGIKCYLLNRPWNAGIDVGPSVERIDSLKEVVLAQGVKYDEGKLRLDLVPVDALREIAKVLTFGANKYADRNWEKGMKYSRVYGALLRHVTSFWGGESVDPETGISHLAHAGCCLMFLLAFEQREMTDFDDRPV